MRNFMMLINNLVGELLHGRQAVAVELDRSIAAAGAAHVAARRALAIAIAEETREIQRRHSMTAKVADIESRAVEAIRAGHDDLALSASAAIATLSTEIEASQKASATFAAEVALARREIEIQRRRLADLDRGRRLARVGSALNSAAPHFQTGLDRFSEAEIALAKIDAENADARAVREEMMAPADQMIECLSDSGFGRPVAIRREDVMSRLREMAVAPLLIETGVEAVQRS